METVNISKDDAIFYLDMVNSSKSPNFQGSMHRRKPYYDLFKEKESDEYRRFIFVYNTMKHVISDREQYILNEIYGVEKECSKLSLIATTLDVSPERIRAIRNYAERKISTELDLMIKNNFVSDIETNTNIKS
ncbi:hypothetical protein [Fredinandcohnia onubensis]|uniref:hypothetical protein n=1 Tax=Fredinandcohnia onubensis TaxID=1571209 RepID=UPI000C0C023A|nr:hypothetical protein [Fredinandcohnia onubensis]